MDDRTIFTTIPETEASRPERWIKPGWNTQRATYIPFSSGTAQCVGKNLARVEIIIVTSALLRHCDMSFAPGYDPASHPRSTDPPLLMAYRAAVRLVVDTQHLYRVASAERRARVGSRSC